MRPGVMITRFIIQKVNKRLGVFLLSHLPDKCKKFETQVNFRGIKLNIFTGETFGKLFYYFNDYENDQIDCFLEIIQPGMRMFDVGANIGVFSILAANKGLDVIAFEPFPAMSKRLKENIELNNLSSKIKIVEEAVADKAGEMNFRAPRENNFGVGRIVLDSDQRNSESDVMVKTNTLDSYVEEYGAPDIIKMDIEGGEIFALAGADKLFSNEKAPIIIVEYHLELIKALGGDPDSGLKRLQSYGYKMEEIKTESDPRQFLIFKK